MLERSHSSPEDGASAGKVLDFLPHNSNATVIGCIQLQRHVVQRVAIDLPRDRQDRGGFACPRGSIEEQMRQLILCH